MSTLAEIEAAVATLTPAELDQLEALLRDVRARHTEGSDLEEIARRNGFAPLPRRNDEIITAEMVRQICEEEGI